MSRIHSFCSDCLFAQRIDLYGACLALCAWLWQGSFQAPQTLMNGSLCVRECAYVCAVSASVWTLLFSLMQNILHLRIQILPLHTVTRGDAPSWMSRRCRVCSFGRSRLFLMPLWVSMSHNIVKLPVTHTHWQVAIFSTSIHNTVTKHQQASRLLWLPELTSYDRQKPLNLSQIWCTGVNITTVLSAPRGRCWF